MIFASYLLANHYLKIENILLAFSLLMLKEAGVSNVKVKERILLKCNLWLMFIYNVMLVVENDLKKKFLK